MKWLKILCKYRILRDRYPIEMLHRHGHIHVSNLDLNSQGNIYSCRVEIFCLAWKKFVADNFFLEKKTVSHSERSEEWKFFWEKEMEVSKFFHAWHNISSLQDVFSLSITLWLNMRRNGGVGLCGVWGEWGGCCCGMGGQGDGCVWGGRVGGLVLALGYFGIGCWLG